MNLETASERLIKSVGLALVNRHTLLLCACKGKAILAWQLLQISSSIIVMSNPIFLLRQRLHVVQAEAVVVHCLQLGLYTFLALFIFIAITIFAEDVKLEVGKTQGERMNLTGEQPAVPTSHFAELQGAVGVGAC